MQHTRFFRMALLPYLVIGYDTYFVDQKEQIFLHRNSNDGVVYIVCTNDEKMSRRNKILLV